MEGKEKRKREGKFVHFLAGVFLGLFIGWLDFSENRTQTNQSAA